MDLAMKNKLLHGLLCVAVALIWRAIALFCTLDRISPDVNEACLHLEQNETCLATNRDPYRYYGTKTPYDVVVDIKSDSSLAVKGCTPKVLYLFSRHAIRYPDAEQIKEMLRILPPLRESIINPSLFRKTKLCEEDLEKLREWKLDMKPEDSFEMSTTGKNETLNLAHRLRKRFPNVLEQSYSPQKFIFEYTNRERTRSTAETFAKGLFGLESKNIDFENKTNEKVLDFYETCDSLRKRCKNMPDETELNKFEKGPYIKKLMENVSKRAGFKISKDQLTAINMACMFGYALNMSDAWCSLLSTGDLKILEYQDDITFYYEDAYGDKLNHKTACPVIKYAVDLFRSMANVTDTKAVMQFTHTEAIMKSYAMFGLFKDKEQLTANGFCAQTNRKWRSSLICPFSCNIMLVYYECEDEPKVAGFVNEKAVKLKGCKSELCSWKDFYETYGLIGEECDLNKLCCTCCKP